MFVLRLLEFRCSCVRAERSSSMLECGHVGVLTAENAIAPGDNSQQVLIGSRLCSMRIERLEQVLIGSRLGSRRCVRAGHPTRQFGVSVSFCRMQSSIEDEADEATGTHHSTGRCRRLAARRACAAVDAGFSRDTDAYRLAVRVRKSHNRSHNRFMKRLRQFPRTTVEVTQ
jgi:hypothetical protein